MATLLAMTRKGEAQQKSGREKRIPTADTAGRDAVSPSLDLSDDGTGSRKEERGGAAGADLTGSQLGGREQHWGALHGKQQQQQQREKSRRDKVWVFRQPVLFVVRQHRGAGGTGLVVIGGVFVGMKDEFVFTMDTPVDRNDFFDRMIRGFLFAARVKKP